MKSYYFETPQLFKMPKRFTGSRQVLSGMGGCSCQRGVGAFEPKDALPYVAAGIAGIVIWNMIRG